MRSTLAGLLCCVALTACSDASTPSVCHGTPALGSLENGVALPTSGENFRVYNWLGVLLHRNYVDDKVRDAVVDAYARVRSQAPGVPFVYGETGWPSGGRFRPHKSHRNGTSVDFFVPVTREGLPARLPTGLSMKFGYNIEFDSEGRFGESRIDFNAMAFHLLALDAAARSKGIGIARVVFDNELQKHLFATPPGPLVRERLRFSTKKPWVQHDEHYHVDFDVPCAPGS